MRRKTGLLLIIAACILPFACAGERIDLNGITLFMADGAEISGDSFGDGGRHSLVIKTLSSLPDADSIEIVNVVPLAGDHLLVITRKHGLYKVSVKANACARIDKGLPPEVIYPFTGKGITKPIIDHSLSRDKRRIMVVVPSAVYLSTDGGFAFRPLPLIGVKRYTELLSGA